MKSIRSIMKDNNCSLRNQLKSPKPFDDKHNADHIRDHPHPVVQQFFSGQVSEEDLAALRMRGTISHTQYLPRDFD